ncbi:MAG: UbiA family prenyltransferase [Chloroflexi bacterium]|nr:UbiA family prenyltransferase [Chloroflexota bacterium]
MAAGVRAHVDRVRLVHPFPSLLNGAATVVLALLAGAAAPLAIRLGLAMTAIQFSMGALNDNVEAPRDRGRRPAKPVAEGLVRPPVAGLVAIVSAGAGIVLAGASGPAAAAVAAAGAACGYAYDLRLSRTAWAWLPLAVALPLVPVFAWVGVTGTVPAGLLVLIPIGMLAGGGLAIGNALADLDVDRASATPSVAVWLGRRSAAGLHAVALAGTAALALATVPVGAPADAWAVVAAGVATLGVGVVALVRAGRGAPGTIAGDPSRGASQVASRGPAPRSAWASARLGWQIEAVGTAILGIGWVLALVHSGLVAA